MPNPETLLQAQLLYTKYHYAMLQGCDESLSSRPCSRKTIKVHNFARPPKVLCGIAHAQDAGNKMPAPNISLLILQEFL